MGQRVVVGTTVSQAAASLRDRHWDQPWPTSGTSSWCSWGQDPRRALQGAGATAVPGCPPSAPCCCVPSSAQRSQLRLPLPAPGDAEAPRDGTGLHGHRRDVPAGQGIVLAMLPRLGCLRHRHNNPGFAVCPRGTDLPIPTDSRTPPPLTAPRHPSTI